jgi:hypothetical protein
MVYWDHMEGPHGHLDKLFPALERVTVRPTCELTLFAKLPQTVVAFQTRPADDGIGEQIESFLDKDADQEWVTALVTALPDLRWLDICLDGQTPSRNSLALIGSRLPHLTHLGITCRALYLPAALEAAARLPTLTDLALRNYENETGDICTEVSGHLVQADAAEERTADMKEQVDAFEAAWRRFWREPGHGVSDGFTVYTKLWFPIGEMTQAILSTITPFANCRRLLDLNESDDLYPVAAGDEPIEQKEVDEQLITRQCVRMVRARHQVAVAQNLAYCVAVQRAVGRHPLANSLRVPRGILSTVQAFLAEPIPTGGDPAFSDVMLTGLIDEMKELAGPGSDYALATSMRCVERLQDTRFVRSESAKPAPAAAVAPVPMQVSAHAGTKRRAEDM